MQWWNRLLDATVVASFDGSGFRRHAHSFDPTDLQVDLSEQAILVTGASGGLGEATATALASRGARVWLSSRSEARAKAACERIRHTHPGATVEAAAFDVSSVADVERWVTHHAPTRLDALIHNAGILPDTRTHTAEGHERTVATNLIGPFALTSALLPHLGRSTAPRIIWVSSGGMLTQKLNVQATFDPPEPFDGVVAYAHTKRAEVEIAARMQQELPDRFAVYSMHPGWAATPGVATSLPRFSQLMRRRLRSPEEGADTIVWLAARQPRPQPGGSFWFDRAIASTHPLPGTRTEPTEARRLWDRLTGLVPWRVEGVDAPAPAEGGAGPGD